MSSWEIEGKWFTIGEDVRDVKGVTFSEIYGGEATKGQEPDVCSEGVGPLISTRERCGVMWGQ